MVNGMEITMNFTMKCIEMPKNFTKEFQKPTPIARMTAKVVRSNVSSYMHIQHHAIITAFAKSIRICRRDSAHLHSYNIQ